MANDVGLAYATLEEIIGDWACEHPELVRRPDFLAQLATEYVFTKLLGINASEIDNER